MAMSVRELKRWINTLDEDNAVAVDDGGLTLVELDENGETGAYHEVGGIPLEDEDEFDGV